MQNIPKLPKQKTVLSKDFIYVQSVNTDIRKTFDRVRQEQVKQKVDFISKLREGNKNGQ